MSVVVLGMHRSGTSAMARLINFLGPSLGDSRDLLPANGWNTPGYWESTSLVNFNDELLSFLGGSWSGPPRLDDGWPFDARLDPYSERGLATFRSVYGNERFVWKDPRNCIMLPFWLKTLDVRPAVVLAHRNPLEVWRSLETRNGMSKALALALWERYLREALRNARGLPALVIRYEDVLEDPMAWMERARIFLDAEGVPCVGQVPEERVEGFLDGRLRHARFVAAEFENDPDVSPAQRELCEIVEGLVGEHSSLEPPSLGPETRSSESLLSERRRGDVLERRRQREHREAADERERLGSALGTCEVDLRAVSARGAELEHRLSASSAELAGREQSLRKVSTELELSQNEAAALTEEALDLGRRIAELSAEARRLHREIERRQELIDAIRRTRFWSFRVGLRKLLGLAS